MGKETPRQERETNLTITRICDSFLPYFLIILLSFFSSDFALFFPPNLEY
jgi:hypothetical protein